ncbi:MAG: NADH-quinone oxidoreductase subunit C [Verrucomicrobiae bacterium]|nr:NADH-quinone oxidoreductase subunit C [Verrucomicrobiae bacterium]
MSFLKTDPEYRFDYASNVAGVDWLPKISGGPAAGTPSSPPPQDSEPPNAAANPTPTTPGYLEVVYHLYSMELKHGPIALRCRTQDRVNTELPSITPLYRGAEFQEREIYDLYGIRFAGHHDLRRILMWDEFKDYPMRKDYRQPDDFEWEPTPHEDVLERAKTHYTGSPSVKGDSGEEGVSR